MEIKSTLELEKLVFDEISFERVGFKNDKELSYQFETTISKRVDQEVFRVSLIFKGKKEGEYAMKICLTGYFSFSSETEISEETKMHLISVNTVSILMPYMRSQISLLSAQPEMECIVLPPFNINNMMQQPNAE